MYAGYLLCLWLAVIRMIRLGFQHVISSYRYTILTFTFVILKYKKIGMVISLYAWSAQRSFPVVI